MRTRYGVSTSAAAAHIATYAEGVRLMKQRSDSDPMDELGWEYQSRIHGKPGAGEWSPGEPKDWDQCQHGSWFFLSWHRMYLLQFERIIASLTGRPDFALPYWDYASAADVEIPPAFLDPDSALFNGTRDFQPLPFSIPEQWAQAGTFVAIGGARRDTPTHRGQFPGFLELNPHNIVHGIVGGDMGDYQSPLDPLFWIHHCNIDRLWEVWLDQGGRQNPDEGSWANSTFDFPDPDGRRTLRVGDMATTAQAGYAYDDTTVPGPHREQLRTLGLMAEEAGPPPRRDDRLELLSATDSGASVRDRVEIAPVPRAAAQRRLSRSAAIAGEETAQPATTPLFLRLENVGVEGGNASAMWNVYVRVGNGERQIAGTIAPFGLAGLTASGGRQTLTFDISQLAEHILADPGDALEVTFEPVRDNTQYAPFWERAALYTTAE